MFPSSQPSPRSTPPELPKDPIFAPGFEWVRSVNRYFREMGLLGFERGMLVWCVLVFLMAGLAAGDVVVIGKNVSVTMDAVEATFAPPIKGPGECGILYIADPLDACTPLKNKVAEGSNFPFVLITRGGCKFDEKVRTAQHAGFKAVIVYDNEDIGFPITMAGSSSGIYIHAVFVSRTSGEVLKKYAGSTDVEVWILPTFENSAWSIMAISFISLLAMSSVLATCFFVRRHRIRRERPSTPIIREFHGMSSQLVKAMPSLIFKSALEDNCTSRTCAICLEDYNVGEKLRILPCRHKFHALCVDAWLTTWRTFCPVCKRDARTSTGNPSASECTPLLSSGALSPSSSTAALSSFHSSVAASPSHTNAIPIMVTPPQSPLSFRNHSLSSVSCVPNSYRSFNNSSFNNSPALSISRSSSSLRNASFHRSHPSHIVSPHSFGQPMSSPMSLRYTSPYFPSSSNASPSYLVASSSRQSYLRCCSESRVNLSAQASDHSLSGC